MRSRKLIVQLSCCNFKMHCFYFTLILYTSTLNFSFIFLFFFYAYSWPYYLAKNAADSYFYTVRGTGIVTSHVKKLLMIIPFSRFVFSIMAALECCTNGHHFFLFSFLSFFFSFMVRQHATNRLLCKWPFFFVCVCDLHLIYEWLPC